MTNEPHLKAFSVTPLTPEQQAIKVASEEHRRLDRLRDHRDPFRIAPDVTKRRPESVSAGLHEAVDDLPKPIDWPLFWKRDTAGDDFLVEPIVARGRHHAIYAPHKEGKSLLTAELAAALATGRPVLDRPQSEPMHVGYFDMEMTEDDLFERLTDFGYGPDDDLSHLHYFSLPMLPALDTWGGGEAVMQLVDRHGLEALVIDTFGRVVEGSENDADTVRAYFRYTGSRLKAAGLTTVRVDHAGKDLARGQRGSSSKGDDVDVVWELTARGDEITLKNKASRLSWIPERVALKRTAEPLAHKLAPRTWPAGTAETAALLDAHDVAIDATASQALTALRTTGQGKRKELVLAALKHRQGRP